MRLLCVVYASVLSFAVAGTAQALGALPCRGSDALAETAAELLLDGTGIDSDSLVKAARAAGFDGLALHARLASDPRELEPWLRGLSERGDGPLVCGAAEGGGKTLVVASVSGGSLQRRGRTLTGRLEFGFSKPHLVLEGSGNAARRIEVTSEELRAGVTLEPELGDDLSVQLVAEGPNGPRPVAQLALGHGAEFSETALALPRADDSDQASVEERVRSFRQARGSSELRSNALLRKSAQGHAERVCASGRVLHKLDLEDDPEARLLREHVRARRVGEAIARDTDEQAALTTVLTSPSHRLTVAEPSFTDVGFGRARDAKGRTCFVVLLASWPQRTP